MKDITTFYIDLDGTVYDKHNGMWQEMSYRIDRYMHEVLGIPKDQVEKVREGYYRQYGSTLHGLQLNHKIDSEAYLAYVHDLDLDRYLTPDPELRRMLESISQPKWILTNSDRNHSQRVLDALGLSGLFDGILDVWAMDYIPKPDVRVYQQALRFTGNPNPGETVFIDDTLKNLGPAQKMGIKTVWIDSYTSHPHADISIPRIHELPAVLHTLSAPAHAIRRDNRSRVHKPTPLPIVSP